MKQRRFMSLAFSVLLIASFLLPGSVSAQAESPRFGGTFVFGAQGDPVKLDPADVTDGISLRITRQVYDTLVEFDGSSTRVRPALAESWETSADGLVWTFHLRPNVTFHDGTPFNAAAVKDNFDRWMDPNHRAAKGPDGRALVFEYFNEVTALSELITSTQAVDDVTFTVTLREPQAPFITNMALGNFAIIAPAALDDVATLNRNPVGTGPFRFVEWAQGEYVRLQANESFWGGRPYVDEVIVRAIPDNASRFLELKAGTIDMMEGANPDDVNSARVDPELQVVLRPSLNVGYVELNKLKAPFSDLRVRQAMAHAINKTNIVNALYAGIGVVAKEHLAPGMLGYNELIEDVEYNPELARQLLAAAGYPNGFKTDFWYMPVSRPYYPNPQAIAEAICNDLAQVMIQCELRTKDWGQYLEDTRSPGTYSAWMLGWTGDNGDPDNFLFNFFGVFNPTSGRNTWDNALFRDLLRRAQRVTDPLERERLYQFAITLIRNDLPSLPIAHTTPPLPARSYVMGYVAHPTGNEPFRTVWLNK
jgi:peptide/nickel transport system substrate-binding protein